MRLLTKLLAIQMLISGFVTAAIDFNKEWSDFKAQYNKVYDSELEELKRRQIFSDNLQSFRRSQELYEAGLQSYWLDVNEYSDLTTEEHMKVRGINNLKFEDLPLGTPINNYELSAPLPASVDWRTQGACNPVRTQGDVCNACVAFCTTEVVESHYYIHQQKKLNVLSPQDLLDCSTKYGFSQCDGGWPDQTLKAAKFQGIQLEQDYPYKGVNQSCSFNPNKTFIKIKDYKLLAYHEDIFAAVVANEGPIIVPVTATAEWLNYKGGILKDSTKNATVHNHAVVFDGYGTLNGEDYWLARNSWGTKAGINGYFLIRRNTNEFGLAYRAYYPVF